MCCNLLIITNKLLVHPSIYNEHANLGSDILDAFIYFSSASVDAALLKIIIIIIIIRSCLSYSSCNLQPTPRTCFSMPFLSPQDTWLPTIGCVCYIKCNIALIIIIKKGCCQGLFIDRSDPCKSAFWSQFVTLTITTRSM